MDLGDHRFQRSKFFSFSGVYFFMNFVIPKWMKIILSSFFFFFFLDFCTSHLNQAEYTWLKFQLYISEYEWAKILLLTRVLPQNFNTIDLVNFLEKNQKLHTQIVAITLKMTSCRTWVKKKSKTQDSMGNKDTFLSTMPFNPWVVLATWLHVGVP